MTVTLLHEPTSAAVHHREVETIFGRLRVRDDHVLRMDNGLLGFADGTSWVVVDSERPGTAWLQSLDHPALAFLMLDPFAAFDGYVADVPPTVLQSVRAQATDELAVFVLVTLPEQAADSATANLRGPLVINWRTRRGAQYVVDGHAWSVREPIPASVLG